MFPRWTRCKEPPQSSNPSYTPKKGPPLPHHRAKDKKIKPLLLFSEGRTAIQQVNLPVLPGQKGFAEPEPKCCRTTDTQSTQDSSTSDPFESGFLFASPPSSPSPNPFSRHQRKRLRQVTTWQHEVLPKLIDPFLGYLAATESLRNNISAENTELRDTCSCKLVKHLSVSIVRFSKLEFLQMTTCACESAPVQLVKQGLFPSAPHSPSLAVEIRLLEFALRLFKHIPPNTTAWCNALDGFLAMQGYKLTTTESLRRRFGECLLWYSRLRDAVDNHITIAIEQHQESREDESHSASGLPPSTVEVDITESVNSSPYPPPTSCSRPSEYLRRRCPLCFGGHYPVNNDPNDRTPNAIVCVDACFKQKRRKSARDPVHFHPDSLFISEGDAYSMESIVNNLRNAPRPSKRPRPDPSQQETDDGYDGDMRVPTSVLDGCESSFTAADERREKASTKFFDSTALMALLCRHDRVLWLVDMSSAGEKQHYVLILIETLFQHLPLDFTIGLLYDIGCQLHRSCIKWGFLARYLPRLTFGISVFHAFGHQWPCQLIYHPRKCIGFGLSDGEGCERFWNSLSKLIPYLRVSGYHHRLYTLDRQIHHSDLESMERFAAWLVRRSQHCAKKRQDAQTALNKVSYSETYLRHQWKLQVFSQTQPLPRQSKAKGKQAVEEALRAQKAQKAAQERLDDLLKIITSSSSNPYAVADAEAAIPDARIAAEKALKAAASKIHKLGVSDRDQLDKLINNAYISARMNAQALKIRLREKLRARRFELDRLRDALPGQQNESKLRSHTESAIKKRDPSIQQLTRNYNQLCSTMALLIKQKKAPSGVTSPIPIDHTALFTLDVDNPIWWDDDDGSGGVVTPPPWLASESVRNGIRALLELDRCSEEQKRLERERSSLQLWFSEEWNRVNGALGAYRDQCGVQYQLECQRRHLLSLCATWQRALVVLRPLDGGEPLPNWGPSEDELLDAQIHMVTGVYENCNSEPWLDDEIDSGIGSLDTSDDMDCQEYELLETIESLTL